MKRLIVLVTLVLILTGLLLSEVADSSAPIMNANIPDNEVINNRSEANNSWASGFGKGLYY